MCLFCARSCVRIYCHLPKLNGLKRSYVCYIGKYVFAESSSDDLFKLSRELIFLLALMMLRTKQMPLSMSQDSFHQFRNLPLRINSDKELKSIGGINYFQLFQLSRSWQAKNVAFLLLSSLSLTSIKVTSSPMALRGFLVLLNCCTSCYCAASRESGDTIRQFRRLDRRSRTTTAALRPTQVDFKILLKVWWILCQ